MSKQNPLSLLGQAVRCVGKNGRMLTVILSDYKDSDDSYGGAVLFPGTIKVNVTGGTEGLAGFIGGAQFGATEMEIMPVLHMTGLRRFPYTQRPNYAFQFVLPGEDEEPLRRIATANQTPAPAPVEEVVDTGSQPAQPQSASTDSPAPSPQSFDPADANQDGVVSDKERRKFEKHQRGEG